MGNTTYDPFDVSHTDQPYQGDMLNPDFARNLMAFGAATMQGANARTGGGFLANGVGPFGPIGAGIQGAMEQNMAAGRNRAAIGLTNAETQGRLLSNLGQQMSLPFLQQQLQLRQMFLQNPAAARQYMQQLQGGGMGSPGDLSPWGPQSSASPGSGGDFASGIANMEGTGGRNDATNPLWPVDKGGPLGLHQFTADTWRQFAQAAPQVFGNMSPRQVLDARTDPDLSTVATNWYRAQNAPILQAAGIPPTDQNLAIAHTLGGAGAAKVLSASDDTPLSRVIPGTIPQNPQYGNITVGQLKQRYAQFGGGAPSQQGGMPPPYQVASRGSPPGVSSDVSPSAPPGAPASQQMAQNAQPTPQAPSSGVRMPAGLDPNQAMGLALQYEKRANDIDNARQAGKFTTGMDIPFGGGDPVAMRQTAQTYRDYATKYWLQQSKPESGRGPGSFFVSPTGVIQAPIERQILGPDLREYTITQSAVETGQPYNRPPGVPAWAPEGTLTIAASKPAPGEVEAQKASAEDAFGEQSRKQYASALGTIRSMADMERQLTVLNSGNPNWYNTGTGADFKLSAGKTANSMLQSMGLGSWFDPEKLAAGEDLMKQTKLAGLTVLNTLQGAQREAASIITSTQNAVPNIENTPQGAYLVLQSIKEAARWQADMHAFMANWSLQHRGNMVGADVAFQQERPADQYTDRGVSMVRPIEVSKPQDMKNYLPGTHVYLKGTDPKNPASIKEVPGSASVRFVVPDTTPVQGVPQ